MTLSFRSALRFSILAILIAATIPSWGSDGLVRQLNGCESLEGWSKVTRLVADASEGNSAVAATMQGGRRGWRAAGMVLDYAPSGTDLSKEYAVSFAWRVEGKGLRSLYVRLRNYPIAGGLENMYVAWDKDSPSDPSEWQRSTFVIAKPDRGGWGREPDKLARTLRFQARLDMGMEGSLELFVDDIVVVSRTFEWEVGDPVQAGDRWQAPVTLRNVTDRPLSITLGRGDNAVMEQVVPEGATRDIQLPLPKGFAVDLKPLQMASDTIWAEAAGVPVTRSQAMTRMVSPIQLPPHPRLLFNADGVKALKRRIEDHDWARALWDSTLTKAESLVSANAEIPPRGGNWWHWYMSPKTGSALEKGKLIAPWTWEHIDPLNGDVYLGDKSNPEKDYDGVVILLTHGLRARAIRDLGVAYQVTGDRRYAEKAREMLLDYSRIYPTYPLHDTRGRAGSGAARMSAHPLDESSWLTSLTQGADLVWDVLSEDERQTLAENVLRPAVRDVILPFKRYTVHNIQCWMNSAVGSVGFLLGDSDLIWEAIENPIRGYRTQMAKGVGPGGMWYEGTWHYHWFTISAVWNLTEAARNSGIDLYGDAYKRMFDAPLRFAAPNWKMPAFNDGFENDLRPRGYVYELGYARYRDPDYLALLAETSRNREMSLWFGESLSGNEKRPPWRSFNDMETGYAVLARGKGEQATWLCLDYGPHGGGHGHPDKLGFVLSARGETVGVDPGTARYGLPVQGGWYKTTLAHNTLLVDESPQRSAEGTCLAFGKTAGVDFAMADAGKIHSDVSFVRSVALIDENLLVFIDQVSGSKAHVLDMAYHTPGTWQDLPEGTAWAIPDTIGYQYLRDATTRQAKDGMVIRSRMNETWDTAIGLAGGSETEVITATGVGKNMEDRIPVVIYRRKATETVFGWCVALDGKAPEMRWLKVKDKEGKAVGASRAAALEIRSAEGKRKVLVANPGGMAIEVEMGEGQVWRTEVKFGVR